VAQALIETGFVSVTVDFLTMAEFSTPIAADSGGVIFPRTRSRAAGPRGNQREGLL
jgi:hypothetical protein